MEIPGRDSMQERPGQMQRLYLLLAPISALFLLHTKETRGSRPTPLPSHRPTAASLRDIWAVGSTLFSLLARKSPDPAGMPERTASLWTSFPLFGFEDNFHEERLAALGGCLGIERVLISFLVYVYFPIRQRQSFLPYELYIQTITH